MGTEKRKGRVTDSGSSQDPKRLKLSGDDTSEIGERNDENNQDPAKLHRNETQPKYGSHEESSDEEQEETDILGESVQVSVECGLFHKINYLSSQSLWS